MIRSLTTRAQGAFMSTATGELIRMMNFVDDIAATLRRINANLSFMTQDEKKRLAEYMRKSDPNFVKVLESLEK
jgi:hypothetical protein